MGVQVLRLIAGLTVVIGLMGCAVGNTYDFSASRVEVPMTESALALGVVDTRAYVLSGDTSPQFVGFQQDGYGNAFDVTTESGAPLSRDFAEALRESFTVNGTPVEAVDLAVGTPEGTAIQILRRSGADRLLLLEMREWKTDVLAEIKVHWNLTAGVYDGAGHLLARENSQGVEGTGHLGGFFGAQKANLAVDEASRRFTELLQRPTIATALRD